MYGRRAKEDHRDTVTYEIDMLDWCAARLTEWPNSWDQADEYVYIEAFLLHYRNLIRFFSGRHHGTRNGVEDLSTHKPVTWAGRDLAEAEINTIQVPAVILDKEYFDDISQYIQHCTTRRAMEDRGWNAVEMYLKIDPIIREFERYFPRPAERPRHRCEMLQHSGETTVTTQSFPASSRDAQRGTT